MVRIPCFHCWGLGLIPGQGTKIPPCCTLCPHPLPRKRYWNKRDYWILKAVQSYLRTFLHFTKYQASYLVLEIYFSLDPYNNHITYAMLSSHLIDSKTQGDWFSKVTQLVYPEPRFFLLQLVPLSPSRLMVFLKRSHLTSSLSHPGREMTLSSRCL